AVMKVGIIAVVIALGRAPTSRGCCLRVIGLHVSASPLYEVVLQLDGWPMVQRARASEVNAAILGARWIGRRKCGEFGLQQSIHRRVMGERPGRAFPGNERNKEQKSNERDEREGIARVVSLNAVPQGAGVWLVPVGLGKPPASQAI